MKPQTHYVAGKLRERLLSLRRQIASGEESSLFVWAIPDQLACCQRPLRDHPEFGGRGRPLPPEATAPLLNWIERIRASGILSIITLMHPKELKYYETIGADPDGLLGLYRSAGFAVAHIPWADPAHERTATARAEVMRHLENVRTQALAAFKRLPKPVLLHCSAAIDRSPPVVAHIISNYHPE